MFQLLLVLLMQCLKWAIQCVTEFEHLLQYYIKVLVNLKVMERMIGAGLTIYINERKYGINHPITLAFKVKIISCPW